MSTIDIPQNGEREYFRAFGIYALFVAASAPRMPCLIGFTRDLGRSIESIRTRWHWSVELTHAWWLADENGARAILAVATEAFSSDSHGRFDAHADAVAMKIERTAATVGTKLTHHADAFHRVQVAVAHVDGIIEEANASGKLRWFNKAYREWRVTAPENMALALPYGLARSRLRAAVVRRIARGEYGMGSQLWSEVLPAPTDLEFWRNAPKFVAEVLPMTARRGRRVAG